MATTAKLRGEFNAMTPVFRASYLNVYEPVAADPRKPHDKRYGGTAIFDIDQEGLEVLRTIANNRCKQAFGESIKTMKERYAGFKTGFRKDISYRNLDSHPYYQGKLMMPFMAKPDYPPGLFRPDGAGGVIQFDRHDPQFRNIFYSGCFCVALVSAYSYDHQGNIGVGFGLNHIVKVKEGESLGGGTSSAEAANAFGAIEIAGDENAALFGAGAIDSIVGGDDDDWDD